QVYNGVRISTNARFGKGANLGGGINIGRTRNTNCTVIDSPQQQLFCDTAPPWSKSVQFRLNGVLPLPWWGLQVSGAMQVVPGVPATAPRSFTAAEVLPSLGRALSGATTVSVPLFAPGVTLFEPFLKQVDFRISKSVKMRSYRLEGDIDIFNLLNANA